MLSQAEELSQIYSQELAKTPPPSSYSLAEPCLNLASVWFSIDLNRVAIPKGHTAFELFSAEEVWRSLRNLGVEAVWMENLRKPGKIGSDPKWGDWAKVETSARKMGISLIGDLIGNATAPGIDFQEALQNVGDYPNLYHLIEIDRKDWKLLPSVPAGSYETNVPWLTIQELQKQGYVSQQFNPYVKESAWNTTMKIRCIDGKVRRWIYLKEGKNQPVLAWLSPSFAAYRLAAGDALENAFQLGQRILRLDGAMPQIAQETLSLWVRKIGAYSAVSSNGTIQSLSTASADLVYDASTRPALLHALIAENAEALKMIYRLFLEMGIESKRLVHVLQSFDQYVCDWVELMHQPKKKFRYFEEQITGELLRHRLLTEDLIRIESSQRLPLTTWVDYCARALGIKDFEKHSDEIANAHLLLAFTYAMQPGAFSFSMDDLLGALPNQTDSLDLMGPNSSTLYSSLLTQLKNPKSFASQLKAILEARYESNIATGELTAVLPSAHPGTLLLLYRLPKTRFVYLLAINFARKPVEEWIELAEIRNTSAINVMSSFAEEKVFSSGNFSFILPPLSGRAFYFQPKYYD